MAFDNTVSLVGNVTRTPELRFTQNGAAVCSFGIAWNQRSQQGEDKAHFFDISCWRDLAENVAESITTGMRVSVYGRLDYRTWDGPNGENRSAVQIVADEVSPSLKWATAVVDKNNRGGAAPTSDFNQSEPQSDRLQIPRYPVQSSVSEFGSGFEIPDEEPF